MTIAPTLNIIEVEVPLNKWCSNGHTAPDEYKRSGPDSLSEPIRFFRILNDKTDIICCEPCLVIANYLASQIKQNKL